MPRDINGNYTLPESAFQPNTPISSTVMNSDLSDIASALTLSMASTGVTPATAPLKHSSGTAAVPGVTFSSDTGSGLYLPQSGQVGLVTGTFGLLTSSLAYYCSAIIVVGGGTGYVVGDRLTISGGTSFTPTVLTVATLTGSAIATATIATPGRYTATPSNPASQTSTTGSGSGATFTITWSSGLLLTDLSGASLGQPMGASPYAVSTIFTISSATDLQLAARTVATVPYGGTGNTVATANALIAGGSTTTSAFQAVAAGSTGQVLVSQGSSALPVFQTSGSAVSGLFTGLSIKVASNTTVTVSASAVTVTDGSSVQNVVISATCNLGTNGVVNTLDTGTIAAATWYAIWAIAKADGTAGTLASTSFTSPTLPSTYTFKARIGAVRTASGSAQLLGTWQFGRLAQYVVGLAQTSALPSIASSTAGTFSLTAPTYTTVSITSVVPTTASQVGILAVNAATNSNAAAIAIAPSTNYSGIRTTNPPPISVDSGVNAGTNAWMMLETTTIAWCSSNTGALVCCVGWVDNF